MTSQTRVHILIASFFGSTMTVTLLVMAARRRHDRQRIGVVTEQGRTAYNRRSPVIIRRDERPWWQQRMVAGSGGDVECVVSLAQRRRETENGTSASGIRQWRLLPQSETVGFLPTRNLPTTSPLHSFHWTGPLAETGLETKKREEKGPPGPSDTINTLWRHSNNFLICFTNSPIEF